MAKEIKLMSKKQIEKIAGEHQVLLDKIKKRFNVGEERANEAIDIACDFNIQNEEDLMETVMVIIHTIERIED